MHFKIITTRFNIIIKSHFTIVIGLLHKLFTGSLGRQVDPPHPPQIKNHSFMHIIFVYSEESEIIRFYMRTVPYRSLTYRDLLVFNVQSTRIW
jgi:hypothetical protein